MSVTSLEVQRQISDLYRLLSGVRSDISVIQSTTSSDTDTTTNPQLPTVPGQAANQVRNASFAHSVQSWFPLLDLGSDADYECAFWYSHSDDDDTPMDLSTTGNAASFTGSAYNLTNGSTDRTVDMNATTIDELADLVYSMWSDLNAKGYL